MLIPFPTLCQPNYVSMKITLTGSLGNIGRPLTQILVEEGHEVTVVSTNPERKREIEAVGAKAAIGSMQDLNFLSSIFVGADAVYLMEPPVNFFDHDLDIREYYQNLGNNFVSAILSSNVNRVVHLSSIGAHMSSGNGILSFTTWLKNCSANYLRLLTSLIFVHLRFTTIFWDLFQP